VRYVLEGSVRKASGRIRITGQLIDAVTGTHLWADRFERDLTDIFALQDEVTVAVVSAVQPKLLQTEIAMAARRRPENLTAYDLYLRAMQPYYLTTREGVAETIRLAHRAFELDPGLAEPLLWQVTVTCKTSFGVMRSILNSSARKQLGFLAWR
jgi:adenylate cyclase